MAADSLTFAKALAEGSSGRHETFTPRYGWLKKGYDRCLENPHVFNDEDAIEQLGVGKNMVRSIRYWCTLFRLLEKDGEPGCLRPTEFGRKLLDNKTGWDPYLEDPTSLWLLHWQIFKPPFRAVCWNVAFSYITLPNFTIKELSAAINEKAAQTDKLKNIAKGSVKRDASCIIRMYASETSQHLEIRCPFTDLGLIKPALEQKEKERYCFATDAKQTLSDWIFMSAVFDFAAQWFSEQQSLSLQDIAFAPNSPGLAFRLSESDCGHRLDRVCRALDDVSFTYVNGIRQIQFAGSPEELAQTCLSRYYEGA